MQFLTALSLFATAGSVTAFPFSARDDPSSPKDFNKACTLNTTLFADGNNQGPFLIAECTSGANPRTTSILPLNHCIANSFGQLVGQEAGGYGGTCYNQKIHDDFITLEATCEDHNNPDQDKTSTIDLSTVIGVAAGGQLACFKSIGDVIHL